MYRGKGMLVLLIKSAMKIVFPLSIIKEEEEKCIKTL